MLTYRNNSSEDTTSYPFVEVAGQEEKVWNIIRPKRPHKLPYVMRE